MAIFDYMSNITMSMKATKPFLFFVLLSLANAAFGQHPHLLHGYYNSPTVQAQQPQLMQNQGNAFARAATFDGFKTLNFQFYSGVYEPSGQGHWYYNAQGKIERLLTLDPAGVDTTHLVTYAYDAQGRNTQSTRYIKMGSNWLAYAQYKWSYFANGLPKTYLSLLIYGNNRLDTNLFTRYTINEADAVGRSIKSASNTGNYRFDTAGGGTLTRYEEKFERDSTVYEGLHRFAANTNYLGSSRNGFSNIEFTNKIEKRYADSAYGVLAKEIYYFKQNGEWKNSLKKELHRTGPYTFAGTDSGFSGPSRLLYSLHEVAYHPRLSSAYQNDFSWPDIYNPLYISKTVDFNLLTGSRNATYYRDSLEFDANGDLNMREYQGYYGPDTTLLLAPTYKTVVLSSVTGITPTYTPQPVIIARTSVPNTLKMLGLPAGNWTATVVDMQGRIAQQGSLSANAELGVGHLAPGVYALTLASATGEVKRACFSWAGY